MSVVQNFENQAKSMDHDGLDELLDGPTIKLSEKEIEELLRDDPPKALEPVRTPCLEYVPTPINQQGGQSKGSISLDSGISFAEFEERDGGRTGDDVFELRADLRNLPDRAAPLPSCLRFDGRYYSDPLRIGLAFRVARAVGVLRKEDFLDPIPDLRARARVGEAQRREEAMRHRRRTAARPARVDLRKTIEAKATPRAIVPTPASSTPTSAPGQSLLEKTAVEMFECARSARMEITTLRKDNEDLRNERRALRKDNEDLQGEKRALRDEIRGLREFMKTKGVTPPPWGPSFRHTPSVSDIRGKLPQQI